jgi:putative RNA 2'-phosphotransferase
MTEQKSEADVKVSKYMSYLLRHHPEKGPIELDEHGWCDVEELIRALQKRWPMDRERLDRIVREDEKQRYSYSEDHTKIRANQGHSIPVDVELTEAVPPAVLYHGTGEKSVPSIRKEGLKPMSRLYVHLSLTAQQARKVGSRHGHPVVFAIDAGQMAIDGYAFYLSANHIWLTKEVPAKYLHQITF